MCNEVRLLLKKAGRCREKLNRMIAKILIEGKALYLRWGGWVLLFLNPVVVVFCENVNRSECSGPSQNAVLLVSFLQMEPSKHTMSQQRRYNVAATSRRCSDVVTTFLRHCVFAGKLVGC